MCKTNKRIGNRLPRVSGFSDPKTQVKWPLTRRWQHRPLHGTTRHSQAAARSPGAAWGDLGLRSHRSASLSPQHVQGAGDGDQGATGSSPPSLLLAVTRACPTEWGRSAVLSGTCSLSHTDLLARPQHRQRTEARGRVRKAAFRSRTGPRTELRRPHPFCLSWCVKMKFWMR